MQKERGYAGLEHKLLFVIILFIRSIHFLVKSSYFIALTAFTVTRIDRVKLKFRTLREL